MSIGVSRAKEVVGLDQPATTTEARATSATASRNFVTRTVRDSPPMLTSATAATAATPTGRAWSGHRYAPAVSASATHEAVLPTTNPQPATYPHVGPSWRRPY